PRINELALDWRALAFAAATMLVAACAFSLIPALDGTRPELNGVLSGRRSGGGRHHLQQALVVWQVAASVLLVGAALLLTRSYYNLIHVDTGFDTANTMTFHVAARWDEDRTRVGTLQIRLLETLEALPHVQAPGMTNFLPAMNASLRTQFWLSGVSGPNQDGSVTVGTRTIGGHYLQAIKAPLVAGAWCPQTTTEPSAIRVALVNQRL